MTKLNLPVFEFRTRLNDKGKTEIFDAIRKKYILLTPEENVRQHFVQYLIDYKGFPPSLMAIEKGLKVNNLTKRTDIVQYNKLGKPIVIVECKAPNIQINEETFAQTVMYNMQLHVDYLVMTNGLKHFCCKIKDDQSGLDYLHEVPMFDEL